ncbi:Zinc finger and SCAN domain-containing protein 29 [Oryzias melastigma]|uniref:Zinc finger and SCAN domain-containing protein 29 n=1 Tax=Oryzias melastigma TaxID=30732 RepID=A0A834FJD6_ORYME|nr:Zinc finger and SCAN domain-containing protein 29 [Oryzias melastigma]
MDDCILSSLSLPLGTKPDVETASCSPTVKESPPPEHKLLLNPPVHTSRLERPVRQRPREARDSDSWSPQVRGGNISQERKVLNLKRPCHETIDLTVSNEAADTDSEASESNQSLRAAHGQRKRKLSGGVDVPTKQLVEAPAFLDSSVDGENSNESPLISIWGEYTDSQERPFPALTDSKVPWSDEETLYLLDIWGKDSVQRALKGCLKNRHIFTQIAQKMAERGYLRTAEQCQTRIKRLKKYLRQSNKGSSRLEHRLMGKLEQILGSTAKSAVPELTYNVEEVIDEDESQDGDGDLQFIGQTGHLEIGTLKGQEQVKCKFYNELGRILVKDFASMMQLDEVSGDSENNGFPSFSHQDVESVSGIQEERRKVPWSDKETIILLEIWGDPQVQQCLGRYPHNGHVFTEVSEKLRAHGYFRSAEQCHTRIKRLKSNYRQCKENMSSSGTDQVDFKFYDLLEQILEKQPSTSSTVITDSIEISEESNGESVTERDEESSLSAEKPATSSWSDEETLALIEIWGEEDVQKALRDFVHNGHVYAEISERLQDLGFLKSPEQCRWKVKSLRINFRQCYDRKKCGRKVDYKFYQQLEKILGQEAVSLDEYDEQDEQPDKDAGDINAPWTEEETFTLIEVWAADDVQHSLKTCVRNGHVFADIAEKMATLGYLRTAEQCQTRIKRLKKTYRRYCNSRRNGGRPSVFRYFNLLAPVLGDNSVFPDVDTSAADAPLMDSEPVLFEQPSTSQLVTDMSRKMPWSELETRTLLEIWGEDNVQLTLRGCLKNRHVFEYISEKMNDSGFIRTTEQCYTRIKRLKYGFVHEKEEFKFFNEMDKIFRKELKLDTSADMFVPDEPEDSPPETALAKG